VGLFFCEGLC